MWTRGLQLNPDQTAPQKFYTPVFLLSQGSFVSAFSLPLTTASLPFTPQGTFFTYLLSVRGSGPFLRATTVLTVLGVPGYCHTEMAPWWGNATPNTGRQQTPPGPSHSPEPPQPAYPLQSHSRPGPSRFPGRGYLDKTSRSSSADSSRSRVLPMPAMTETPTSRSFSFSRLEEAAIAQSLTNRRMRSVS